MYEDQSVDRQQIEVQMVASVVAVACALPGTFLVLRRLALLSDAISHTILLGIVLAYFLVRDLYSPWLIVGAAAVGVLTVVLVEWLTHTGQVREDAAVGLVFPFLFSLAVVLISRYNRNEHLDVDAVLKGDLVLSVFDRRWEIRGVDVGPQTLFVSLSVLILNVTFISVFYKELKLAAFDSGLAATFGFAPTVLNYALTTSISLTAVASFDAVGSILVVALMIGPPATAYLLTDRLSRMLILSAGIGVVAAVGGYWLSHALDVNIAGAMATTTGICFIATWICAPDRGLLTQQWRRFRRRWAFAQTMLAVHLLNHEGKPEAARETLVAELHEHLRWQPKFLLRVVQQAERGGIVLQDNGYLALTDLGRQLARTVMVE